jgi:degradative hydroxymethylglutaryl-CoA reductase
MTVVSAPGKAFLIGEYGVLHGGSCIVTAAGVRAIAHEARPEHDERPAPDSPFVQAARKAVSQHLADSEAGELARTPVVTTVGFESGGRKLGLGSSAAVTAAIVGYHLSASGVDLGNERERVLAFRLASEAHRAAQGGVGSGGDVAAACYGGTLVKDASGRDLWTPLEVPSWLHVGFFDAGAPASTRSLVEEVDRAAKQHASEHARAVSAIQRAAIEFRAAWSFEPVELGFGQLAKAVSRHNEGLAALERISETRILTPKIATVIEAAEAAGLAAKPSGAGGGDLVVVFSPSRSRLDHLASELRRAHGIAMLRGLSIDAPGLMDEVRPPVNSRIKGFFKLGVSQRRKRLAAATGLDLARFDDGDAESLGIEAADHMVENVIGCLSLPLAVATNFRINGRDLLVPMCVEESSVIAAASNAAKMVRAGGGFGADADPPWMIAQIQLLRGDADSAESVLEAVAQASNELLALADTSHPRLVARGGGARKVEARILGPDDIVVHVLVDCQDAMGANLVNTVAEAVAPRLETLTGWRACLRILSNLADRRASYARARIPAEALATEDWPGATVVERIVEASRFAELDPYRATTHNKGIMNGVDAVVLATGNDWRAMEASAHAYAAREGSYGPLAVWRRAEDGCLLGEISLPTAVGVVGGATRVHPAARLALEILGKPSGIELGQVLAAVGLASNLAALRALATEGIQRGHMSLHARTVAASVGATGEDVERVAARMIADGEIKVEHAEALLAELRANG